MKIGIDGRLWYETGVGRYIRALVYSLISIDATNEYVLLLPPRAKNEFKKNVPRWKIEVSNVHWHTIKEQLVMPGIYNKYNLDLLHVPYFSVPIFTQIPFVVTLHDLTVSHFATGRATTRPLPVYALKRLAYNLVISETVRKAKHIITVSNAVKRQIVTCFPGAGEKTSVIYESGELEQFSSPSNFVTPKNYLLYVGNAHPHKNLEQLIDAFLLINKNDPNWKLVLVGKLDFFYNRLREKILRHELTSQVLFIGEVSNQELSVWYSHAKAFVFPSLSEGFGIPGLEAMGFGCPVIASDIEVFKEIYQDAAVYFDPRDKNSIATSIIKVIKDRITNNRLKKAGARIFKRYSWKKMAQDTLSVYENSFAL